jgi:hypothetical protein
MANQAKTTLQFPVANTIYSANDRVIFIYGVDTANSGANSVAQTATISISNFIQTALTASSNVGDLPSSPYPGQRSLVTDSNVDAAGNFGANVASGGSYSVPVYYDAAVGAWRIG